MHANLTHRVYRAMPAIDQPGFILKVQTFGNFVTFCAIMGPSSTGKTTLLDLITGQRLPDDGVVLFDGRYRASGLCQYRWYGITTGVVDVVKREQQTNILQQRIAPPD